MKNSFDQSVAVSSPSNSDVTVIGKEAKQLISLGRSQRWDVAVLGRAPMPEQPVWVGDWLIVPSHLDTSEIPDRALERVSSVFEAGLRPKGFVLVHEAPKLLNAPMHEKADELQLPDFEEWAETLQKVGLGVLGAGVAAVASAAALVLPLTMLVGAVLVDPILIAVTEDDCWVEIDRWWN